VANRGRRGEDAVYYDHQTGTVCRDARYHRKCSGRWRAEVSLGKDGAGKRVRRRVAAKTKTELYEKLDELRQELAIGSGRRPPTPWTWPSPTGWIPRPTVTPRL